MIKIVGKNLHIEIRLGLRDRLLKLTGLKADELTENSNVPVLAAIHGAKLYLNKDHALPHYLRDSPLYDSALPAVAEFIRQRTRRPISIIDIGANIGDSAAVIAAATTAKGARFICVEADAQYLPLFEMNTKDLDVKLVHAIAGDQSGKAMYQAVAAGTSTSVIAPSETEMTVVTVDELAGGQEIDLLKIDTDGYEYQVLSGAGETLKCPNLTIFMEYSPYHLERYGTIAPEAPIELLAAAGYTHAIVYDNQGFLMGRVALDTETIRNLARYALHRPAFYYDLVLHKEAVFLNALMTAEIDRTQKALPKRMHFNSF